MSLRLIIFNKKPGSRNFSSQFLTVGFLPEPNENSFFKSMYRSFWICGKCLLNFGWPITGFFVQNPSKSIQSKCGTKVFWRVENEYQHFWEGVSLVFQRISSIYARNHKIDPFPKTFCNKNAIKIVTPYNFFPKSNSGWEICEKLPKYQSFEGQKSSF